MNRAFALLAFGVTLRAETVLLAHDAKGALLRQAPAVLRAGGLALVGREALFGASSASIIDADGRMHPVLWISAEDADAGVVEVFVGAQAPPGPHGASSMGLRVRVEGHEARVRSTKEAGGFGIISRLDCGGPKETGEPLYDEHGLLAGWHATRAVDGQVLAFAVPLARFESSSQTMRVSLAEWNASRSREKEAAYQRGMGHLWVEDFDGALFYFRKAVETQPENGRAWYHLAFAEGKTGHGKAKTACYKKAVELEPGFAPARYYLGFSLLMNGDRDGALVEYKKLKELDESWALRLKLFLDAAHVDVLERGKPRA
ncbi:MAG: tetratricopeptide repeat protein [Candidatus Solibacter usitatus]|nr:tetratricopeptide repeat protein [Candidatus Solibacter usitatus]